VPKEMPLILTYSNPLPVTELRPKYPKFWSYMEVNHFPKFEQSATKSKYKLLLSIIIDKKIN